MNIPIDRKTYELMCPKCQAKTDWNNNGDLECSECNYIYYMFSDKDNSFQMELFNEVP